MLCRIINEKFSSRFSHFFDIIKNLINIGVIMSLLVVGSIAYDTVETPFGKVERAIGGSAMYSSVSASFFHPVNLVAVVGSDFPDSEIAFLASRGIDTAGLEVCEGSTFAWEGKYGYDLNSAQTVNTHLNVFEKFNPSLPDNFKGSETVLLGNIDPILQMNIINQISNPRLTAIDTMNHWITSKKDELLKVISRVDIVIINDAEARQLTDEYNIIKAAYSILKHGPRYLIIKRGEYGSLLFYESKIFSLPAFPLEVVKDPTGAGDSFAGGFMGYISRLEDITPENLKQAVVVGTVMASINVEDFSLKRFKSIKSIDITERIKQFKKILHFEEIADI
ncbi:PfkB family carbohydrate kinase [bacterium]